MMKLRRRWPALLLLLAGLCLLLAMPLYESNVLIFLNDHLGKFTRLVGRHPLPALLGYVALYVASVAVSFPGAILLTLLGGFGFGAVIGGFAAALSATLGGLCAYLAARALSRDWSHRLAGFDLSAPIAALRRDAAAYLVFLRLMPVFPFWLVNLAAAIAGVPLTTFLWTTFFGVMPGAFAFATAGEALGAILQRQAQAYRDCLGAGLQHCRMHLDKAAIIDHRLLLALGTLGALALIPVAIRRIAPIARFCERKGWIKPMLRGEPR
jgi:uncharacterized membrane protein YdjX (TVP38/TMEM64 family)